MIPKICHTLFVLFLMITNNNVLCKDYNFQLGDQSNNVENSNNNNANANNDNNPNAAGQGAASIPSVDVKSQFDSVRNGAKIDINSVGNNINNPQIPDSLNINKAFNNRQDKRPDMDKLFNKGGSGSSNFQFPFQRHPENIALPKHVPYKADWAHFSMQGFWASLSMIIVSEIGDKTFFIAAILAMKHSRFVIWLGAAGALVVMTILAVVFGSMLQVIPSWITHYGAGLLFLIFGLKLLWEAKSMTGGEALDELKEAEEELMEAERQDKEKQRRQKQTQNGNTSGTTTQRHTNDIELGNLTHNDNNASETSSVDVDLEYKKKMTKGWNFAILLRAFYMTFISEIGDRSQITTVVLAAHRNPYGVTLGASMGHAICTALAVIGGKLLASKISEKNVTIIGGILFLAFSLECFVYGPA